MMSRRTPLCALTRHGVAFVQRAQEAGFGRKDMPPGLALIISGGLIEFCLHSELEILEALTVTGDENLSDEAFLEQVLNLVRGVKRWQETAPNIGRPKRDKIQSITAKSLPVRYFPAVAAERLRFEESDASGHHQRGRDV